MVQVYCARLKEKMGRKPTHALRLYIRLSPDPLLHCKGARGDVWTGVENRGRGTGKGWGLSEGGGEELQPSIGRE